MLGEKLAILLYLAAPKRVSEISKLDRRFMSKGNKYIKLVLPGLSKTQKDCQNKTSLI
jgi:hypothetical protein